MSAWDYHSPFANLPGADHAVLDEGVARGEVHGGLVGGEDRYRARAVGKRAEGEEHATVHELGVPGLMRGEVLRREGEVAALVEKDVPQGIPHFRCLSRASRAPALRGKL